MGNRITNAKNYEITDYLNKSLKMSNGLTAVFIDVLTLNASKLATSEHEIEMAVWLASRDQTLSGLGSIGFDISEMPWSLTGFHEEKQFILRTIDTAKTRSLWDILSYRPREDWTMMALEKFRELIEDFTIEFVSVENYEKWQETKPKDLQKCVIHGVFRHWQGCVVCNN